MKAFTNAFEFLMHLEERDAKFHMIILVTVDDLLQFYTALGRFPSQKEIEGIRGFGVERVIGGIQLSRPLIMPDTLLADLYRLESARIRFLEAVKTMLKQILKIK